jgi:hypothetical protein
MGGGSTGGRGAPPLQQFRTAEPDREGTGCFPSAAPPWDRGPPPAGAG